MSKKIDLGAALSGRIQQRAGTEHLGPDRQPERFATPFVEDALEIAVDHIRPSPDQPRKYFDQDELSKLADSLRRDGVLQPISVNRTEDGRIFEIESGERRWRAAGIAGLNTIPCIVRDGSLDSVTTRRRQISENIHRSNLKPIEAARSVAAYVRESRFSQREAAEDLSVSKTWIAELLTILTIPDSLIDTLEEHERCGKPFRKRALVELAGIKDEAEQQRAYERMVVSKSPLATAREVRTGQSGQPRASHFHRLVTRPDYPGYRLTVSVSEPPEKVDPSRVASFMREASADYADEQAQPVGGQHPG